MLARLFGKKCDHPMADMKSAQALLSDLSRTDTLKCALELTEWIESVSRHEDFRIADKFAILSLLDETAQPYSRKLAYEYFTMQDLNTFQGNRLCQVLGNLSRHTAHAYFVVFNCYCDGDKGGNAIQSDLPLLVARTVRAMREQLKYDSVHYKPHDNDVWRKLAQMYRSAEQLKFHDLSQSLYSDSVEASSVRSEMGKLMAWYACGISSMNPQSMHLAERLISQYGNTVEITSSLARHALFSFDLAHPLDPVRVNLEATVHPLMRYISMVEMQAKLEALIDLLEKKTLPPELNLGGVFPVERVLESARHVLTYLVTPPLRLSKRREVKAVLNVVTGYENVVSCYKWVVQGGDEHPSVPWNIEDVSATGFGAILSGRGKDKVSIDELLGVYTPGASRMGVAIVRRLKRDESGNLRVGSEMLSGQIAEVELFQGSSSGNVQVALWLHEKAGVTSGMAKLLMRAGTFSMERSLKTCFEDVNYLLIPSKLTIKGRDFDMASFRLIRQEE